MGTDFDRGTATPYRWSWQDDDTPAVALEVNERAVSSAISIGVGGVSFAHQRPLRAGLRHALLTTVAKIA